MDGEVDKNGYYELTFIFWQWLNCNGGPGDMARAELPNIIVNPPGLWYL